MYGLNHSWETLKFALTKELLLPHVINPQPVSDPGEHSTREWDHGVGHILHLRLVHGRRLIVGHRHPSRPALETDDLSRLFSLLHRNNRNLPVCVSFGQH